jgi:DNA-binding response OmpR family regulator
LGFSDRLLTEASVAEKILIVDDDLESLKLIGLMLQRRGYEIVAAQGGAQALARAEAEQPNLIILDVMMPDMDGFEVCRRLRAKPGTAHTPILMFTAKSAVGDKVTGFQAGADDYLTKPIHPAELASRVEAVLLRTSRAKPAAEPARVAHARIVGFIGCKGGVGTTTLALNAAIATIQEDQHSQQTRRIVLAELMTGSGAIGLQIGMTRQIGIANLLNKRPDEIDARAVESQLTTHTSGVKILLAPVAPRAASLMAAHTKSIIQHLATENDLLFLDLGSGLDDGVRAAVQLCHYVVVVIESQRVALTMAQNLIGELEALAIPRSNIGLVLINRAPSASSMTRSTIEDLLKSKLLVVVPPAPELAFQAGESGTPMIMMQPNSLLSTQIRDVAHRISEQ